jgi:23S rRNA (cytidine1920-2'-O)/16S rRNA (cytidine1409-2'-O)-methyltransferase
MKKVRIDKLLLELNLVHSRERGRALIMAGRVLVNETAVTKAGALVDPSADIRIKGDPCPYVSRGGVKLAGALDDLSISVLDKIILDVGASTGGFTDVCLQRGALKAYTVDVGTNQLDYAIRRDQRVYCLEQTNARDLMPEMLPGPADMAVIDVSFISISKILASVIRCLTPKGEILAMVKPQFEAGREHVGKGGVVRDPVARRAAVDQVSSDGRKLGLIEKGRADARIQGPKGNQETFVYFIKDEGKAG